MFGHRELSEPRHSGEAEGEWVDFPASPEPDPWGALLRQAKLSEANLIKANRARSDVPCSGHRNAGHAGGAVATSVAMVVRGLLVTTTAVATIAYLLLTNSHI
jgi:hypothetical protein